MSQQLRWVTDHGVHGNQLFDPQHHLLGEGSRPEDLGHQALGAGLLGRELPAAQQQLVSLQQKQRSGEPRLRPPGQVESAPTEATPMMRGKVKEEQASGVCP